MLEVDEDLLAALVGSADDAVIVADVAGDIRYLNAAAEAMFGLSAADALGASLDLIIPERLRERHWEGFHRVMATGETEYAGRMLSVPALRADGATISVEFTVNLLRDGSDAIVGIGAIMRDVTERFQEDRRLRARLAELERA
jgi:PAS domain S-box-containing protein